MRFVPCVVPGATSCFSIPCGPSAKNLTGIFLQFGGKGYSLRRVRNIRLKVDGRVLYEFSDARQVRDLNFMRGLPHRLLAKRRRASRANLCIYPFGDVLQKREALFIGHAQHVGFEFDIACEYVAPTVEGLLVLEWR
jgi:hypothetical protein